MSQKAHENRKDFKFFEKTNKQCVREHMLQLTKKIVETHVF